MVKQMAKALHYMHQQGLLHCDVNPSNWIITEAKTSVNAQQQLNTPIVKLIDFGTIESVEEATNMKEAWMINSSNSVGIPLYQAPEQIDPLTFGKLTPKTDIYSFGITLYEMFTGQSIHPSPHELKTIRICHIQEHPLPVRRHNSNVPIWLDSLITRCLKKDPSQRPDLEEFIEHFNNAPYIDTQTRIAQLSNCGFDQEDDLAEDILKIRGNFLLQISSELHSFLRLEAIEAQEEELKQCRRDYIHNNYNELSYFMQHLEIWDPNFEECPNLLCRAPYISGQKQCHRCGCSWMFNCPACGQSNSYFTRHCQHPPCKQHFSREIRIKVAYNKTKDFAQDNKRIRNAALALWFIGEHLQSEEQVVAHTFVQQCEELLCAEQKSYQNEILQQLERDFQELKKNAEKEYQEIRKNSTDVRFKEASLLFDEERYYDALRSLEWIEKSHNQAGDELYKPTTEDIQTVEQLRDEICQKLTQRELDEIAQDSDDLEDKFEATSQLFTELDSVLHKTTELAHQTKEPMEHTESLQQGITAKLDDINSAMQQVTREIAQIEDLFAATKSRITDSSHRLRQEDYDFGEQTMAQAKTKGEAVNQQITYAALKLKEAQQSQHQAQTQLDLASALLKQMDGKLESLGELSSDSKQELNKAESLNSKIEWLLQQIPHPSTKQQKFADWNAQRSQELNQQAAQSNNCDDQIEDLHIKRKAHNSKLEQLRERSRTMSDDISTLQERVRSLFEHKVYTDAAFNAEKNRIARRKQEQIQAEELDLREIDQEIRELDDCCAELETNFEDLNRLLNQTSNLKTKTPVVMERAIQLFDKITDLSQVAAQIAKIKQNIEYIETIRANTATQVPDKEICKPKVYKEALQQMTQARQQSDELKSKIENTNSMIEDAQKAIEEINRELITATDLLKRMHEHLERSDGLCSTGKQRIEKARKSSNKIEQMLRDIYYMRDRQQRSAEYNAQCSNKLREQSLQVRPREEEQAKLSDEKRELDQRLEKHTKQYIKVRDYLTDLFAQQKQLAEQQAKTDASITAELQRIEQLQSKQKQIEQREQREFIKYTAATGGILGSVIGLLLALIFSLWWSHRDGIALMTTMWTSAIFGLIMGGILASTIAFTLHKARPHLLMITAVGLLSGTLVCIILQLIGVDVAGIASGSVLGYIFGGLLGSAIGLLWHKHHTTPDEDPLYMVRKATLQAKWGALIGTVPGIFFGGIVGTGILLHNSITLWFILPLLWICLFHLIGISIGYVYARHTWNKNNTIEQG
jgi:serine/threonine protein kinase